MVECKSLTTVACIQLNFNKKEKKEPKLKYFFEQVISNYNTRDNDYCHFCYTLLYLVDILSLAWNKKADYIYMKAC